MDGFIVEHETDAPYGRGKTNIFGAGQVVQNDLWLCLRCHSVVLSGLQSPVEVAKRNLAYNDTGRA
jgi:hypothetical protein